MSSSLIVVLVSLLLTAPALLFWLCLLIVPEKVVKLCPEECWCDPGGYRVNCSSSSLNNIPSLRLTDVRELMLNDNSIPSLEKDSFISRGLTELEHLYVLWCEMETIDLGAFSGLTELTLLSLSHNKIREIIPGTFENMNSLEYLDLADNVIEHLEVDVFCGLVNLKHIHLEENNLLNLHPDLFVGLSKLQSLYLSNNPNLQIPTDHHFINSHSLTQLDISGCNVSSVSVETFANVTALEWLDLRYNHLKSVDLNVLKLLPKLSALYVHENTLKCDCQLQEVWRWCQDHDIQTVFEGKRPHCVVPNQGNSLPWGVVEKRRCLEDNIKNRVDYEHKRYKRAEEENGSSYRNFSYYKEQIKVPLYAVHFIFGITSNAIILIIIISNKDMRTDSNMFIINLAICDMILVTLFFFAALAEKASIMLQYYGIIGVFFRLFCGLSVGLSAFSVALFNIHRYRVTVIPFHVSASSQTSRRVAVVKLFRMWIVAVLVALPTTIFMIIILKYWISFDVAYYKYVVLFDLVVFCVLPLCVIAISYIMTVRHHMEISCSISEGTQHPQMNTLKSTAKVVSGLNFVFLISYVPHYALKAYSSFNMTGEYEYSTFFLLINSCLNPVALFCTNSALRQHLKRYLTCCCKTKSPPTDLELTRRN
jgi:hypothetical protein